MSLKMKFTLLTGLILLMTVKVHTQDIKKEVVVVKSFQPVLPESEKISLTPQFGDTAFYKPKIDYQITPLPISPSFKPRPVSAAKLAVEPKPNFDKTFVKLGFGNHFSPLALVSITNSQSEQFNYGFIGKHHSANGEVKLSNKKDVEAAYFDNRVNLFGNIFFKKSVLKSQIDFTSLRYLNYGYNTDLMNIRLNRDSNTNHFLIPQFDLEYKSANLDSSELAFQGKSKAGLLLMNDSIGQSELNISVWTRFVGYGRYITVGAGVQNLSGMKELNGSNNSIISFNTSISKSTREWSYLLGFGIVTDANPQQTKSILYPDIQLSIAIVKDVINASISLSGKHQSNTLASVIGTNPYIFPGTVFKNTNHKNNVNLGINGKIKNWVDYKIGGSYSAIDNYMFFINDTNHAAGNFFNPIYDDVELTKLEAQISTIKTQGLFFSTGYTYRQFTMFRQAKPWQVPTSELKLGLGYNLRDKIIASTQLFYIGERFSRIMYPVEKEIKHDPYFDLNIDLTYRYTPKLAFFVTGKNILAQDYEYWNQYPAYRFQMMLGLIYKL